MPQNPFLDLVDAVASSGLDPDPISFREQDESRPRVHPGLGGGRSAASLRVRLHGRSPVASTTPTTICRLLDNTPIASVQDRNVLMTTKFDPTAITKLVGGGGRMKFYLVENGFVREFTTPPVIQVVHQVLQRLA